LEQVAQKMAGTNMKVRPNGMTIGIASQCWGSGSGINYGSGPD